MSVPDATEAVMYHVKLSIDDPVLIVPRAVGSARTTVRYESEAATMAVAASERSGPGDPWTPIDLQFRTSSTQGGHSANHELEGDFRTPRLRPGEAYEVRAGWADEPSDLDPVVSVIALAEEPSRTAILTDYNEGIHGTYLDLHVVGPQPHTLWAQVGYRTPVRDAPDKPARIPDAHMTVFDTTSATSHIVRLQGGLRAGSTVKWLARGIGLNGDWHELEGTVTLKQRKVTLRLNAIVVDNDGDPASTGEADFGVEVFEGATLVHSLGFYDGDVDDGEVLSLPRGGPSPWTATIGPHEVTPGSESVRIHARGLEHDGIGEDDEPAASYRIEDEVLEIPEGGSEKVTGGPISVTARPLVTGDDFQFRVEGTYDITYQ